MYICLRKGLEYGISPAACSFEMYVKILVEKWA